MISPSTTRHILESAKIEEVVQHFLPLKRSGPNLTALCPFHHEKTPSFVASPARNTFKCFGCGKGGNAAKFLMEHEGFTFPEALRWLARKYNVEIQETKPSPEQLEAQQEEESLFIVNDFALKFFQSNLPGAGLEYLINRGFTDATIQKFGLGFAPDNWDALTKAATQAGFKLEYLQKLGLTTPSGKDFFRNRVIFPIHNLGGKPIAFAGRICDGLSSRRELDLPKYLNSPESPLYQKSQTLYGIHLAKQSIRRQDECILVEGYTDLISLHQAGIENVVASAGTALTKEQLLLIRRFSNNLKILYDGDPAGIQATLRGLDLALGLDMNVIIVPLPHPDDPDSFLRRIGITAFTEYLDTNAKDFIAFKVATLLAGAGNDPVKKAKAVHAIVDSIARVEDPIKRSFFIKDCAELVGLGEEILTQETNKVMQALAQKQQPLVIVKRPEKAGGKSSIIPRPSSLSKERLLTQLLLEHGAEIFSPAENITVVEYILNNIEDVLEHFEDPLCQRIFRDSKTLLESNQPFTPQYFINHEDPTISALATDLTAILMEQDSEDFSPGWQNLDFQNTNGFGIRQIVTNTLLRLKLDIVNRWGETNRKEIEEVQRTNNMPQVLKLLEIQAKLNETRNGLAKQLNLNQFA
ncbi:MAG: DNA primase [Saprospiraceae bacterium]